MHPKMTWVEALPRVLYCYHNTIGETGLSPFQMVFGRDRVEVGLPVQIPRECEDAQTYFDRLAELDKSIATLMNKRLRSIAARLNSTKTRKKPFKEGDKVWWLRPRPGVGSGLETWWLGPCRVTAREGPSSYTILAKPKTFQGVHRDQLKPHVVDEVSGKPLKFLSTSP